MKSHWSIQFVFALVAAATVFFTGRQCDGAERPLSIVTPESLGLSAEALAKIDAVVNAAIDKGNLGSRRWLSSCTVAKWCFARPMAAVRCSRPRLP